MATLKVKKKPNKSSWRFPLNAERTYMRALVKCSNQLSKLIKDLFVPHIPEWIAEVNRSERKDNFIDSINYWLNVISQMMNPHIIQAERAAERCFDQVNEFNENQYSQLFNENLSIDIFFDNPWLTSQRQLFADQNSKLITGMVDDELERVAGYVERGLQEGTRFTDIAGDIKNSFGISERKATLIARDQTAKLNASITRLRGEEIGLDSYEWSTSMDERVRPSHRANEGKVFKWSEPPKETGNPAHQVNCRCVAIPVLDGLLVDENGNAM